jgi:ribosomal protein S27E
MDWVECEECGIEFKVLSDSNKRIVYCPYCAEPLNMDDYVEELDFEDD